MARRKINKSQKIRDTFEKLGADARPKDVIAALAAVKVKVSSAQVSNIKAGLGGKAKKKGGRKTNGNMIALSDLQAAKKLVDGLGSLAKAQAAMHALATLR